MAVSGKTPAPIEQPYFVDGDKPPNMGTVTKAQADRLHAMIEAFGLDAVLSGAAASSQILIAQPGDVARFKTMSGDATIDKDGVVTIQKDAAVGVPSLRTLGAGAKQAAAGNDARFADERVPLLGSVSESKMADGAASSRKVRITEGESVYGGGEFALTGAMQSLTSREINLATASVVHVRAHLNCGQRGGFNNAGQVLFDIFIDAAAQGRGGQIGWEQTPTVPGIARFTPGFGGRFALAAGKHTISLRAMGTAGIEAAYAPSGFSYTVFSQ
jgi:hypothetical protein